MWASWKGAFPRSSFQPEEARIVRRRQRDLTAVVRRERRQSERSPCAARKIRRGLGNETGGIRRPVQREGGAVVRGIQHHGQRQRVGVGWEHALAGVPIPVGAVGGDFSRQREAGVENVVAAALLDHRAGIVREVIAGDGFLRAGREGEREEQAEEKRGKGERGYGGKS